jgi:catechol 2,3-dioxygenase-like lactoylglutathione lyase family enzyme
MNSHESNRTSILVDDQDKALKFYAEVLGFVKKTEFPTGDAKWLTVVSPEGKSEVEILLESTARLQAPRRRPYCPD